MAVTITHPFVSPVADAGNPDEVGPNEWNAAHTVTGLGTAAEANTTDFATAAQGAKADSALQSVVAGSGISVNVTDPQNPIITATGSGTGDMLAATYDPQAIAGDAFARANHTGTQSADTLTDGTTNKAYTATEKTKLAGIATGATANSSDATLLARANHTGTQAASTISDFSAAADARVAAAVGVSVQAYDADLTTWAGLTPSANAQSLVTAADYAGMRALLDLEAGTDFLSPAAIAAAYQPLDADLTAWAGVNPSSYSTTAQVAAAYQPLDTDLTAIAGLSTQTFGRARLTDTAAEDARNALDTAPYVATRTALKALDTSKDTVAILTEAGRTGTFVWMAGNYSSLITADTQEGVYIKADAVASSAGAWVRVCENGWLNVKHFGAVGDGTTNDKAAIQAAIDLNIGPVFFPPSSGCYILTSAIVLHNGTQLTGGYGETGASGASSHQFPELRWTGTGTYCVTGDDTVDYLYHGSISGLSFSTAAGATYSWIFDFYDLVGWTFKGINCKQIDYTGGGIMRCQETAPANPNWVNILYDFDFSVPTTGTQYLIDIVWTDSQISMGNLDGGKGAIYRGAGNVSTMGVQFNRTGTGYAGLTLRKETASNGQFMVSNCAFDACTTYGLIIDGSASPSGSIYAPAIVGCVFRNPGATADIQFISHASTVLSGPVIDACVFSEVAVNPVVVDEAWWRPTFGNNFYASGWVPFAPAANYDARNRIGAIGRNGINVLGLIAAKASKTVRGAANVAGIFGIEDANMPYALLGVKDGASPYVGASREADGDPTPFGIMVNNVIIAQFGTDLSFINTGRIASSGATHGIGYSAGAGGTVTQATSKSTGVTLSKATGQITMNAAALAASTTVTFTLTNTAIEANDILVLNHRSGGTAGSYALNAQCAAGSATINVRNISGGSLSEAIVISFALIKAVAA